MGPPEVLRTSDGPEPQLATSHKLNMRNSKTILIERINGTANNEDDDVIPNNLKMYVTQEAWCSWSPVRRNSFQQIIKNPNTFFYRNRPPGDPQIYGSFTKEEEELFLKRLNYFRNELNIQDGLWGLFSIPICGRVGYQCSNFLRHLIVEGKVKDSRYVVEDGKLKFKGKTNTQFPPESLKILEKEAFDFIKKSMSQENPVVSAPIHIETNKVLSFKKITKSNKLPEEEVIDSFEYFGKDSKIPDRKHNDNTNISDMHKSNTQIQDETSKNPLCGLTDPFSDEPIVIPMMDPLGFVMDLKSWKKVIKLEIHAPFNNTPISSENELIEITPNNFQKYRLQISNFLC